MTNVQRASYIDFLRQEHGVFSTLLDLIETCILDFRRGQELDYELLQDVFFYLTQYPDCSHHPREDLAFDRLVERSPDLKAFAENAHRQHRLIAQLGTEFLDKLYAALNGVLLARDALESSALEYVALYRDHIKFEEQALFPLARLHLQESDWDEIRKAITAKEDPLFGEGERKKFRSLQRQIKLSSGCECPPIC